MSVSAYGAFECPDCGHAFQAEHFVSVNVTLDPELLDELIEGRMNGITCPCCQSGFGLTNDLVYHDMENELLAYLCFQPATLNHVLQAAHDENKTFGPIPHHRRIVRSYHELLEKVLLFLNKMDDRYFEIFRVIVMEANSEFKDRGEIRCNGIIRNPDNENERLLMFTVIDQTDDRLFISFNGWQDFLQDAEKKVAKAIELAAPKGYWVRIDYNWLQDLQKHDQ
jgi:hypothetical protein